MRGAGDLGAEEIIRALDMRPHPEDGHYVETFRDTAGPDGRARSSCIYFLLRAEEVSAWHRVDAAELWLWHAGGPLVLTLSPDGRLGSTRALRIGPDLRAGERPQGIAPAGVWQTAASLGAWTLASCVVAPGFEFSGFELAPPDWRPQ